MPQILSPADHVAIAYDVTGAGTAVVLLHGSLLTRAIWRGYGYVPALAGAHTVIRVDLRGHGRSGRPHRREDYTAEAMAADVLGVLDAEGITGAAMVGYSLGARLALHLALRAPDRVTHLVSLGGSAAAQAGEVDRLFMPGAVGVLRREGMAGFCERQGLGPDVEGPLARSTRAAFLAADPLAMASLLAATDASPGYDDDELARCRAPALWLAGDRDHPRLEDSAHAAALMPRGRFVALPGRDHASTLTPAGPVLRQIVPFLSAAPEPPGTNSALSR